MSEYNFACGKCPRTFKLEEFYEKHKKVHELKKQHKCNVCGFVYGAAKGLEGHLKTHTEQEIANGQRQNGGPSPPVSNPEIPYNMDFHFLNPRGVLAQAPSPKITTSALPRREKSSSTELILADELSDRRHSLGTGNYKIFDAIPNVDPNNTLPNSNGFYSCVVCKREFSGINSLKKHIPIHTRSVQHSCDVCGFVFGKKEYLIDHMRKHTGEVSPACDICGEMFNKSLKLKEHKNLHRNLLPDGSVHEVVPFRCHMCREVFQQGTVLTNHLATVHKGTSFKCDMCTKMFGSIAMKNEHMLRDHQNDAVHNKSFFCPLCNQGFTRFYNLKVHMVKTHGKEYMENNFSPEEFAALIKSIPSAQMNGISEANTKTPHLEIIPTSEPSTIFKLNQQYAPNPLLSMMEPNPKQRNVTYTDEPPLITIKPVRNSIGGSQGPCPASKKRKPGPASKTNPPMENRVQQPPSNIPSYLDQTDFEESSNGYECKECGKVLQHKQSYVSHMRVIHGNYYGGNKWKGHSSVVDMIIEESAKLSPKKKNSKGGLDANATMCSVCEQVFPNQSSLRNHVVNVHIQGQSFTCDLCGKAFLCQENLDAHVKAKHPNLNKRLQSLRDALGLAADDQPNAKRARLNDSNSLVSGISSEKTPSLPSNSVLSFSAINSSSLSSSPIIVDFPTSKDYANNNNNNNEGSDLMLAQHVVGTGSPTPVSTRKKNSICKVCGVVLSPKTNVNVHMRTHSGARPYQCVLCLNKFRQKAHLMKHFRCSHNQKKPPFICLFCPDECASSNDLYRHITDKHTKETDELRRLNGLKSPDDDIEIKNDPEEDLASSQVIAEPPQNGATLDHVPSKALEQPASPMVEQVVPNNMEQQQAIEEEEEDVRYEPITEAFVFEDQVIHPCYVILPFVTDNQVETFCQRSIRVYYGNGEETANGQTADDDEEEEGQLTIDESRVEEEEKVDSSPPISDSPVKDEEEEETPMLESLLHKTGKLGGLSGEEILHKPDNSNYNAEDIKPDLPHPGFYPNLGDFSLPFSLSSIWKKKMDVLPPETIHQLEMIQKMEEIKQMNSSVSEKVHKPKPASRQNKGKSNANSNNSPSNNNNNNNNNNTISRTNNVSNGKSKDEVASTTQVSDYENQIQNDIWPLDCIKCNTLLGNLENFNLHMNDHWSEDKCCPVCGLLINSKRFNFKQHLKIHTGEKPFTCQICFRSFRQKAHMVKHVTTHRQSMTNSNDLQALTVQ